MGSQVSTRPNGYEHPDHMTHPPSLMLLISVSPPHISASHHTTLPRVPSCPDSNVLLSVWFALLRLLNGTLDEVPYFPAGDLFVKVRVTELKPAFL